MAHQIVLGALLGSAQPYDLGTRYTPMPARSHTLVVSAEPDVEVIRQRLDTTNAVFGVGLVGAGIGVGTVGAGLVVMVVGIIPLVLDSPGIFTAGIYTMVAGMAVTAVSVPVMVGSALAGNVMLRKSGIEVSSVPGLVAVGGVGLIVAGAAIGDDFGSTIMSTGGLLTAGGSIVQVIFSNRAFKAYEQGIAQGPSVVLHPIAALDGYGIGATARF